MAILLVGLFSLVITLMVMPKIIIISRRKNLTSIPNGRDSHKGIVPTLGGIGVFTGLLVTNNITGVLFASHGELIDLTVFNLLLFLFLLVGVRDDLMILNARKKFLFQIIITLIFTVSTGIYIKSFGGLFGIQEIPVIFGMGFTVFVMVLIINAYNLIDGIDGLAGLLGAIISAIFALAFYVSGQFFPALMSIALVGALSAFLVYNFSHRLKIFLGDTGSMIVGFVLAFQVILYLNLSAGSVDPVFKNAPVFVMALLSYPLLDTLRVFIVRIKNGKSPFTADRNHIHHRLIDLGMRHANATLIVAAYTAIIAVIAYFLDGLSTTVAFAILLPIAMGLLLLPFMIKLPKRKTVEAEEE